MDRDLYMTNEEYIRLLERIKAKIIKERPTKFWNDDDTTPGAKNTTSNFGICNDNFTTKEIAMWPEDYPKRKVMKYRAPGQMCPFDKRIENLDIGKDHANWGCFYHCRIANRSKEYNPETVIAWINRVIKIAKK